MTQHGFIRKQFHNSPAETKKNNETAQFNIASILQLDSKYTACQLQYGLRLRDQNMTATYWKIFEEIFLIPENIQHSCV
jgi:hypothetical protein